MYRGIVVKVNKDAFLEYECLKPNYLFSQTKRFTTSDDRVTVPFHTLRSLSKHVDDIVSDARTIDNDITGFTETQINPYDSAYKIIETLNFFNINFENN